MADSPLIAPTTNMTRTRDTGIHFKYGDALRYTTVMPAVCPVFKWIYFISGGDLAVVGIDGNIIPLKGILPNTWVPCMGTAILASGVTPSGMTVTTTATDLSWYGGE